MSGCRLTSDGDLPLCAEGLANATGTPAASRAAPVSGRRPPVRNDRLRIDGVGGAERPWHGLRVDRSLSAGGG